MNGAHPRRFGSPNAALKVLRGLGIDVAQIEAMNWDLDLLDEALTVETLRVKHAAQQTP